VVNENVFVRYKWNDNHVNTFRNSLIAKLPEFNRLTCAIENGNRLSINDALNNFTSLIRNVADPLFSKNIPNRINHSFSDTTPAKDADWFDN
jgi:hypothetical protein